MPQGVIAYYDVQGEGPIWHRDAQGRAYVQLCCRTCGYYGRDFLLFGPHLGSALPLSAARLYLYHPEKTWPCPECTAPLHALAREQGPSKEPTP